MPLSDIKLQTIAYDFLKGKYGQGGFMPDRTLLGQSNILDQLPAPDDEEVPMPELNLFASDLEDFGGGMDDPFMAFEDEAGF